MTGLRASATEGRDGERLSRKPWATGPEHNRRFDRPRVSPSRRNRGQSATESTTWETAALLLAHKKTDPARVYATASRTTGCVGCDPGPCAGFRSQ
jgi:hypothetical protein